MKNIIITGSSGLVASELIRLLLKEDGAYNIYAVSTNPIKLRNSFLCDTVKCISIDELSMLQSIHFTALIHCAFARNANGKEVVASIDYTNLLLERVNKINLDTFVYISSQSVYDIEVPPYWKENSPIAPTSLYGLGKYVGELLVNRTFRDSNIQFTCIRLCSVIENARFVSVFIDNVLSNNSIQVLGGFQTCSFIDVRDVAYALKSLIEQSHKDFCLGPVYNLGTGRSYTIYEVAKEVVKIGSLFYNKEVQIERSSSNSTITKVGMDCSLFCKTFGWAPKYSLEESIHYMFECKNGI